MKAKGFTLIELMIVVAVAAILLSVVLGVVGSITGNSKTSWGFNGIMEMRCVNGLQFTVDQAGNARQVIDEFGKGLRCN